MNLGYLIVYVPDVREAVEFYEAAFGLSRRFIHESGQYAEMETGATALAFTAEPLAESSVGEFAPNRADARAAGFEVALTDEDVSAAYERAVAAGASPHKDPETKPWGQTVAYVRDPNGVIVELGSPILAA